MQKSHPKSLKINEKSGKFQWVAILACKKANIEKSSKNLDRSDKIKVFTKREHAEKNKKVCQKMLATCVSP